MAYWKRQKLAQDAAAALSAGPRQFPCAAAWEAWLAEAGVTTERHVRIATEGALLGQLIEQGVSPNLVILSDDAPRFDVLVHASCWVHAERPLARAIPYTEAHRTALEQVRRQLWDLYQDLKAYRAHPDPRAKAGLESAASTCWSARKRTTPPPSARR